MKIARVFIVLSLAVGSHSASAHDVGNGGNGVLIGDKIYTLDLVEAGVERSPYIDGSAKMLRPVVDSLSNKFAGTQVPVELLGRKLSEIAAVNPGLASWLSQAIDLYFWRFVNYPLSDVHDEDSVLKFPAGELVQVAVRREQMITVSLPAWSRMDDANRVALMIHEAVYALSPVTYLPGVEPTQDAEHAREVTGAFFTRAFGTSGNGYLISALGKWARIPPAGSSGDLGPWWEIRNIPSLWRMDGIVVKEPVVLIEGESLEQNQRIHTFGNLNALHDICAWIEGATRKFGSQSFQMSIQEQKYQAGFYTYGQSVKHALRPGTRFAWWDQEPLPEGLKSLTQVVRSTQECEGAAPALEKAVVLLYKDR